MASSWRPTEAFPTQYGQSAREREATVACMREHRASWWCSVREGNSSAFNGGRFTRSDWSEVRCAVCGRRWRTKAAYVRQLPGQPPAADPATAPACEGSGQPWRTGIARIPAMCPVCDAGPRTLRVPDPGPGEDPLVPDHPDMVAWAGRIDVNLWRQQRAAARDYPAENDPEGGELT